MLFRSVDVETTLLQQFLNIAQRKSIAKIPPDRTEYEAGFGLPPFEDRGSGSQLAILSRHQPATQKSCNTSLFPGDRGAWSGFTPPLTQRIFSGFLKGYNVET